MCAYCSGPNDYSLSMLDIDAVRAKRQQTDLRVDTHFGFVPGRIPELGVYFRSVVAFDDYLAIVGIETPESKRNEMVSPQPLVTHLERMVEDKVQFAFFYNLLEHRPRNLHRPSRRSLYDTRNLFLCLFVA